MESKISILIAEKQELLRKSLSSYLNTKGNFTVVSEANSTKSILEGLKQFYVDLILLDSDIPLKEGYGLFETCKRRFPELKIVLITKETDMRIVSEFMAKGAAGCLNKNCTVETLCAALRTVHTEGYYFDNACSKALLDSLLQGNARNNGIAIEFNDRESEILQAVCDGKTNREIAESMNLSASTIDFYRTRIYSKTKCNNIATLLKFALKNGFVHLT